MRALGMAGEKAHRIVSEPGAEGGGQMGPMALRSQGDGGKPCQRISMAWPLFKFGALREAGARGGDRPGGVESEIGSPQWSRAGNQQET